MTKSVREYTVVPGLVNIKSNVDYISHFFLGENLNGFPEHTEARVSATFKITDDINFDGKRAQRFDCWSWNGETREFYYERPVFGRTKAKLLIKDMLGLPQILANRTYYRLVKLKIESVMPPGAHLTDIMITRLLSEGFTPLHCACLSQDDKAIMLFAPPNTGKSMTTLLSLKQGYDYVAEDIAVTDGKYLYSCPLTSTFLTHLNKTSFSLSLYKFIRLKFSALSFFIYPVLIKEPRISITEALRGVSLKYKSPAGVICILGNGLEEKIDKMSKEEAVRDIVMLNRNEFSYYGNPLLGAYSYFDPALNIRQLMEKEEDLISSLVRNSEIYKLISNKAENYINLLRQI